MYCNRRVAIRAGGLAALGTAGLAADARSSARSDRAAILLTMVGGPSGHETFDPKPDAPAAIRGPLGSIPTALPGVRLAAPLRGLARRMDRIALVRSLTADAPPIHQVGLQLIQTGGLARPGEPLRPHLGALAASRLGASGAVPPFVILPRPLDAGVGSLDRGQSAGAFGPSCAPFAPGSEPGEAGYDPAAIHDRARRSLDGSGPARSIGRRATGRGSPFDLGDEPARVVDAYGRSRAGRLCLLARRLVEAGARVVVVNLADSPFGDGSFDAHGYSPFAGPSDLGATILPAFDRALSALIDDLDARGRLGTTLVAATGEFGRAPRLNAQGGRDHWTGAWGGLLAGGGIAGGVVVGATDRRGETPTDRPVAPPEWVATILAAIGVDPRAAGPASPVAELFG